MTNEELTDALAKAVKEIDDLRNELAALGKSVREHKHHPHTDLMSQKFLARAFAVFGHYLAASLIIAVPIVVIRAIIALAAR